MPQNVLRWSIICLIKWQLLTHCKIITIDILCPHYIVFKIYIIALTTLNKHRIGDVHVYDQPLIGLKVRMLTELFKVFGRKGVIVYLLILLIFPISFVDFAVCTESYVWRPPHIQAGFKPKDVSSIWWNYLSTWCVKQCSSLSQCGLVWFSALRG